MILAVSAPGKGVDQTRAGGAVGHFPKHATGALRSFPPPGTVRKNEVTAMLKGALRRHKSLVGAAVLGVSAFLLSYRLLTGFLRTSPVVVAAKDVDMYQKVVFSDVRVVELPVRAVPSQSFASLSEVVGTYCRTSLCSGQVVLKGHVSNKGEEVGLSVDLPSQTRGMFIPAAGSRGLGGLLKRGERVDVICAPRGAPHGQVLVFPGVPVVEVLRDQSSNEFYGALVMMNPQECELLASSMETGTLYLTLVPRADWVGWNERYLEAGGSGQ